MKNSEYFILLLTFYVNVFVDVTSKNIPPENSAVAGKASFNVTCPTVGFLKDSNFTKSCFKEPENVVCLALHDLSLKWCTKASQEKELPKIETALEFDSLVNKSSDFLKIYHFCKKMRNSKIEEGTPLFKFYSEPLECLNYCVNSVKDTEKETNICIALAWIEDKIDSIQLNDKESKPEVIKKSKEKADLQSSVVQPISDTKIKNEKETTETEVKTSSVKNEPKSEVKNADPQKTQNKPVVSGDHKETPLEINKEGYEEKRDPDLENEKIVEKITNNNPNPGDTEHPVIEKTEVHQDVSQKVETTASKTDKKTEASPGKTNTVQKAEDVKSSTISQNTNDVDNSPPDDVEIPPIRDVDDEQGGEKGLQNQEPDFIESRKIIPRYPGKTTEEESHIFSYFVAFSLLFVCCYIGYLNKKKILAILLEGRRSRNGRGRRRPSTANYRKLDCNLEEAVTSQCNSNVTNVIY